MNTLRTGPAMHTTCPRSHRRLRTVVALVALVLAGQGALAAGGKTGEKVTAAAAAATSAVQRVAEDLRELREVPPHPAATARRGPQRQGMHLVVRLAVVDVVSHPDSGSVGFALRSRLLARPIARAPLAVGVAWRF